MGAYSDQVIYEPDADLPEELMVMYEGRWVGSIVGVDVGQMADSGPCKLVYGPGLGCEKDFKSLTACKAFVESNLGDMEGGLV